jgi:hypothetical protein
MTEKAGFIAVASETRKEGLLFVNKKKQKNFLSVGDSAVSVSPLLQGE